MDKQQVIKSVKKLVGDAELEKALEELIAFLDQDDKYDALKNAALQALSQLRKTRKDESLGIISFDNAKLNYNQVTHQTLNLVDLLEEGKTTPEQHQVPAKRRWIAMIVAFLIVGTVSVVVFRWVSNRSGGKTQAASACPSYKPASEFNMLVFPFQQFGGVKVNADRAIVIDLARLSQNYQLNTDVALYEAKSEDINSNPANLSEATEIGQNCNAQLVIIGTEEKLRDSFRIITEYKFLSLKEHFELKKLKIDERSEVNTVDAISSITTQGVVTNPIKQTILLLFGVVAYNMNNKDAAIASLELAEVTDSASTLLKGMVLGDSYLEQGKTNEALESYNKVLERHPNYALALQNRAAIYFQKGDYMEAASDLTTRIETNPNDAEALEQRGTVFLKVEQLDKARKDLLKAKELQPTDKNILDKLKRLDVKVEEQRELKKDAERQLQADPDDVSALNQRATASKNLGDYRVAVQTAEKVLKQDPKNTEALSTIVESAQELNRPDLLKNILDRIKRSDVNTEQLKSTSPTFYRLQKLDTAVIRRQ